MWRAPLKLYEYKLNSWTVVVFVYTCVFEKKLLFQDFKWLKKICTVNIIFYIQLTSGNSIHPVSLPAKGQRRTERPDCDKKKGGEITADPDSDLQLRHLMG